MKRVQLFEFEDFPWFPHTLRQALTLYLRTLHRMLGTADVVAPRLANALRAGKTDKVIDLCSGGGGPMVSVGERLREQHGIPVSIRLTDLYPNVKAAAMLDTSATPWITYETKSVNAGDVPPEMVGVRSMICSFHHMPLPVAKSILQNAFQRRQPLCVFEISDNSQPFWLAWLSFPVGILMVLFVTPFVRPLTLTQLLFTYIIPVLPIVIAWDGMTSNMRTYTAEDLRELTRDLQAADYTWEIETIKVAKSPGPMLCLLGLPN